MKTKSTTSATLTWDKLSKRKDLVLGTLSFIQVTANGPEQLRANIISMSWESGLPTFHLEEFLTFSGKDGGWVHTHDRGDLRISTYKQGAHPPYLNGNGSIAFSIDIPKKGFLTGTIFPRGMPVPEEQHAQKVEESYQKALRLGKMRTRIDSLRPPNRNSR